LPLDASEIRLRYVRGADGLPVSQLSCICDLLTSTEEAVATVEPAAILRMHKLVVVLADGSRISGHPGDGGEFVHERSS
jgi:hypothetical protein